MAKGKRTCPIADVPCHYLACGTNKCLRKNPNMERIFQRTSKLLPTPYTGRKRSKK